MARVTEKLRIQIDHCTPSSPFYVAWVNDRGGWDFWLFDRAQKWGGSTQREQIYEPYFPSLSATTSNARAVITRHAKNVTVYAEQLTQQEADGLETLRHSPRVYWLDDLMANWMEIIPNGSSYTKYETDGKLFKVSIDFTLPRTNIPTNG